MHLSVSVAPVHGYLGRLVVYIMWRFIFILVVCSWCDGYSCSDDCCGHEGYGRGVTFLGLYSQRLGAEPLARMTE